VVAAPREGRARAGTCGGGEGDLGRKRGPNKLSQKLVLGGKGKKKAGQKRCEEGIHGNFLSLTRERPGVGNKRGLTVRKREGGLREASIVFERRKGEKQRSGH